jgi:hypothetical protein
MSDLEKSEYEERRRIAAEEQREAQRASAFIDELYRRAEDHVRGHGSPSLSLSDHPPARSLPLSAWSSEEAPASSPASAPGRSPWPWIVAIAIFAAIVWAVLQASSGIRLSFGPPPDRAPVEAPARAPAQPIEPPQGDGAQELQDQAQTVEYITADFTMDDMTTICQVEYGVPDATAALVQTSDEPPGYWIKCIDSAGNIIGNGDLDLQWYCNEAYDLPYAVNPDIWAADAWTKWHCASSE